MESNDLPRFEPIDRKQIVLEPLDIEQLIPEDHAARNIWGILGGLDLSRFLADVKSVEGHAGRNTWEPRLLIAMWIYAYSRGISSAREIERQCAYNVTAIQNPGNPGNPGTGNPGTETSIPDFQIVWDPLGWRRATMNAQTLTRGFFQLPGQSLAFYNGSGFNSIRHADWLGSTRLSSAPDGTYLGSMAVAPYGEEYAGGGTPGLHFTGQRILQANDLWDFPRRELHPVQGRWISPDPAGLAAVHLTDPQTWNRYAYVRDTPTSLTDPTGLQPDDFCYDLYYAISHAECANLPGGPWGSIYPVIPPFPGGGSGRVAPGPTKRPPISGFPNGETLGLPTGLRIPPPTLGGLLGFPDPTGCEFGPCVSIGNQLTTGNEGRRPQFPFLPAAAIGN